MQLRFDPQDSVQVREIMSGYLCAGSLAHLEDNRSIATVKCPLDGSIFARSAFAGQICKTCELCTLGVDALGLSIQLEAGSLPQEASAGASSMAAGIASAVAENPMASAFNSAADPFL